MKVIPVILALLYLWLVRLTMGLRPEHFVFMGFLLICYYLHSRTRRFIIDFFPFACFGTLYDFLRVWPKSWTGSIQVVWPYVLEKALFGVPWDEKRLILCEFARIFQNPFLDIVSALAYSLHMVVPIAFALALWFRQPHAARNFAWAFFIANLMAFATYIVLPVAPPWYIELYGFRPPDWSVPPSAAGLANFDLRFGVHYFQKIYSENAWVFGAVPSMHAGYPLLVILFAHRHLKKALYFLYPFLFLIWFAAVYLRHHYVIDLAAGALYAVCAYFLAKLSLRPYLSRLRSQVTVVPVTSDAGKPDSLRS